LLNQYQAMKTYPLLC